MMALAQEYGLDVYQEKIADYLPQAAAGKGNWQEVTFNHAGDMATGNFSNPSPLADQVAPMFFGDINATDKLRAAFELRHTNAAHEVVINRHRPLWDLVPDAFHVNDDAIRRFQSEIVPLDTTVGVEDHLECAARGRERQSGQRGSGGPAVDDSNGARQTCGRIRGI